MRNELKALIILVLCLSTSALQANENLTEIKNYQELSSNFSSAGLPKEGQFVALKNAGFKHVINLIPGDYESEKQKIESLNMTFDQIGVVWKAPRLDDFKQFAELMKKYQGEKVIVHCQLNYRASAFAYLYQVTQQGVTKEVAYKQMAKIWEPEGTWAEFIETVESYYKQ